MPPGVYFRMLLVGYLEGIGSERGIAWRCADSFSLREFLGYGLAENPPEHSTLSKTRKRLSVEAHAAVFGFVLERLRVSGLLRGNTLGVDATTLEANAAMRTIVRRADGTDYEEWLAQLARASGIETPTREDLAKLDRKRPKKGSNQDWVHPHDPEARITKMKDGRTHLAHKLEHAVDMETGAIVGLTVQTMDGGDTASLPVTLDEAERRLAEAGAEAKEVVADKGYHSNETMTGVKDRGLRSYVSEPNRGRRKWKGKRDAQKATYGNRRRVRGNRGKRLQRGRGEKVERPFAHMLETGGMRASTFGARRTFENECSSTPRPSTSGSSCASGSALEPPVHCRASLPYKLHSQLTLQPAFCASSAVSGAIPPFLSRISPPHAGRPPSCTTTPRPRVRFLSQPSSAGHPLLPRAASASKGQSLVSRRSNRVEVVTFAKAGAESSKNAIAE